MIARLAGLLTGLITLAVKGPRTNARACWHADHYIGRLSPAVMQLRQVVHDLVKANRHKIGKLHFHHALKTFKA